jgi:hypothetical protein
MSSISVRIADSSSSRVFAGFFKWFPSLGGTGLPSLPIRASVWSEQRARAFGYPRPGALLKWRAAVLGDKADAGTTFRVPDHFAGGLGGLSAICGSLFIGWNAGAGTRLDRLRTIAAR